MGCFSVYKEFNHFSRNGDGMLSRKHRKQRHLTVLANQNIIYIGMGFGCMVADPSIYLLFRSFVCIAASSECFCQMGGWLCAEKLISIPDKTKFFAYSRRYGSKCLNYTKIYTRTCTKIYLMIFSII